MSTGNFGKYRIERRLAAGGMAELFVGFLQGAKGFERKVAIKRILPHLAADPSFQSMFWDEATLAANLSHPNVVQVLDFGEESGQLYMALEFVDGIDLKTMSRQLAQQGRRLSAAELALIAEGVAAGLHHVHTATSQAGEPLHIIHRDISPHNVMVTRDGHIKVMDFGVAHADIRSSQTATGVLKGKLAYMAPEQANDEPLDHRVDQFALGLLLWELAVGEAAYQGPNDAVLLRKVLTRDLDDLGIYRGDLPEALIAIVMKMLERDPENRFDDMEVVNRAALQVRFGLGEEGATARLAGLSSLPRQAGLAGTAQSLEGTKAVTGSAKLSDTFPVGSEKAVRVDSELQTDSEQAVAEVSATAVTHASEPLNRASEAPTRLYEEPSAASSFGALRVGLALAISVLAVGGVGALFSLESGSAEPREVELRTIVNEPKPVVPPASSEADAVKGKVQAQESDTSMKEAVVGVPPTSTDSLDSQLSSSPVPTPSTTTSSPKKLQKKVAHPPVKKSEGRGDKAKSTGALQLRVEEGWFNVMLGTRRLGTTPLGGVTLPVGRHVLTLENPVTGLKRKVEVQISKDQVTKLLVGAD